MISLEQLQQIRDLVRAMIARMQSLEQENAALSRKLSKYEGDIDDLSQENRTLEKHQQVVEVEFSRLLNELQDIQLEQGEPFPELTEPPKQNFNEMDSESETISNEVTPSTFPQSQLSQLSQLAIAAPVEQVIEAASPAKEFAITGNLEKESHSLDISLGIDGDSLLMQKESAPAQEIQENIESSVPPDSIY